MSASAFSRDIRDYLNAHWWAVGCLVSINWQIWPDTHLTPPQRNTFASSGSVYGARRLRTPIRAAIPLQRFVLVIELTIGDMDHGHGTALSVGTSQQMGVQELMRGYVHEWSV